MSPYFPLDRQGLIYSEWENMYQLLTSSEFSTNLIKIYPRLTRPLWSDLVGKLCSFLSLLKGILQDTENSNTCPIWTSMVRSSPSFSAPGQKLHKRTPWLCSKAFRLFIIPSFPAHFQCHCVFTFSTHFIVPTSAYLLQIEILVELPQWYLTLASSLGVDLHFFHDPIVFHLPVNRP